MKLLILVLMLAMLMSGVASAAWHEDWDYRTPIEIDGNTEDLTDYQVQITLQGTNSSAANYADFDKILTGGDDIRFTDSDQITDIDFWIEGWNDTSKNATIWVEIPSLPTAGTKIIYIYYGKSGSSSASDGDETFEFFDDFHNHTSQIWQADNAVTNLSIPTYDGSGQQVHPDIHHFDTAWNGYTYWMGFTPYPDQNSNYENPSIVASNDGLAWVVPAGLTNPIEPRPPWGCYSDCDLNYNASTDELWVYYRFADAGNDTDIIYLQKSSDGINWGAKISVLSTPFTWVLSPAIVPEDNNHFMWAINATTSPHSMDMYTSSSGENFVFNTTCDFNIYEKEWWHVDIFPHNGIYRALINDELTSFALIYASSTDKTHWDAQSTPVLEISAAGWDEKSIYRTCGEFNPSNDSELRLWYSARNDSDCWHVGYTVATLRNVSGYDQDKWSMSVKGGGANYSIIDDQLWLNATASIEGAAIAISLTQVTNDTIVEFSRYDTYYRYNIFALGYGRFVGSWGTIGGWQHAAFSHGYVNVADHNNNWKYRINWEVGTNPTTLQENIDGPDYNQWIDHKIIYTSTGIWNWYADSGSGYVLMGTGQTNTTYLSNLKNILLTKGNHAIIANDGVSKIDNLKIRKYTATEPTAATTSAFRGYNNIFSDVINTISPTDYVSYSAEPDVGNLVDVTSNPTHALTLNVTTFSEPLKRYNESASSDAYVLYIVGECNANTNYVVNISADANGTKMQTFRIKSNTTGYIKYNTTGYGYDRWTEITPATEPSGTLVVISICGAALIAGGWAIRRWVKKN